MDCTYKLEFDNNCKGQLFKMAGVRRRIYVIGVGMTKVFKYFVINKTVNL